MLCRTGASPSLNGNVRPQDGTDLLRNQSPGSHFDVPPMTSMTLYVDDTTLYIAGYIARKLQRSVKCLDCALALTSSRPIPNDRSLISIKDNGGLIMPCPCLHRICKTAELIYRTKSRWGLEFISVVLEKLQDCTLFPSLQEHHLNTLYGIDSHLTSLIRLIIKTYFNIRQHHRSSLRNMELHNQLMRRSFTTILHSHFHQ